MTTRKIAVVLFNLGGPDSLDAVRPFLFNLFHDPAILTLPQPFRFFLAWLISSSRRRYAEGIYKKIGGKSPIYEHTREQAEALEKALNTKNLNTYKVFFTMRYWIPLADNVVENVKNYAPDEVILLPLYPQFSTTTTNSSISNWFKISKKKNLKTKTRVICCYPDNQGIVDAYFKLIKDKYEQAKQYGDPVIIFSAHGIPLNRVKCGDPYEWQVKETVRVLVNKLGINDTDYIISYQSKVGPLKWLSPPTDKEVMKASQLHKPIVIVPISFVSEHAETLVELDIVYKELASQCGCPAYFRVNTLGTDTDFINGLAKLCFDASSETKNTDKVKLCPASFSRCICQNN
jgi:ferrochelatase